uniref:Uncharacterized protein n=1 Tax=Heterosigma akashiwo TaxID=2829 RepID=A0A7S3YIQ0_HETAK
MHGTGVKVSHLGDKYVGEYQEDQRQGYGVYTWPNGDRYEGEWQNNLMEGLGIKYFFVSGESYDGEWQGSKAHGMGTKYFANGDRHEGMYQNDVREGRGKYFWSNGDFYEGTWVNGQQTGLGTYRFANGDVYEGIWRRGKKHGTGYLKVYRETSPLNIAGQDQVTTQQTRQNIINMEVDQTNTENGENAANTMDQNSINGPTIGTRSGGSSTHSSGGVQETVWLEFWEHGRRLKRYQVTQEFRRNLPIPLDVGAFRRWEKSKSGLSLLATIQQHPP